MFFVRLDGSPYYAMWCNAIAAVINILFDYIFIFIFGWGLMGAAIAQSAQPIISYNFGLQDNERVNRTFPIATAGLPYFAFGYIFFAFNIVGIGLSLSRQIIRMHGGDLTVSSQPYSKTTFRITLPSTPFNNHS